MNTKEKLIKRYTHKEKNNIPKLEKRLKQILKENDIILISYTFDNKYEQNIDSLYFRLICDVKLKNDSTDYKMSIYISLDGDNDYNFYLIEKVIKKGLFKDRITWKKVIDTTPYGYRGDVSKRGIK